MRRRNAHLTWHRVLTRANGVSVGCAAIRSPSAPVGNFAAGSLHVVVMVRETVRPGTLPYASNRVQITREGDGLVAVFPPTESAFDFWVQVATLFGLSVFCLVC